MAVKERRILEFGDFQTPDVLADKAISVITRRNIQPRSILEPTCGKGSFLRAALEYYPGVEKFVGLDINEGYLADARRKISGSRRSEKVNLITADFFTINWTEVLDQLPDPLLIIGNPPWVTSSELGSIDSKNLPEKTNFQGRNGYEAITGKSNFDISEWMLLKNLEWIADRHALIGMLCKTAVARKILLRVWKESITTFDTSIYLIDAKKYFDASVDACFLVIDGTGTVGSPDCRVYEDLDDQTEDHCIGYREGVVVSDVSLFRKWEHLKGSEAGYRWRSGIKHDCSRVMELEKVENGYMNKDGRTYELEDEYIYPLMKSSDVASLRSDTNRYLLVTQHKIGEDTSVIASNAPLTWDYLERHAEQFDKRRSSIYNNKPNFSIFGVGHYSFSPWKIAISSLYKKLAFRVIGPFDNKPVVLDDTVNFLPCYSEPEAHFLHSLLESQPAKEFYESMIFWSDKRPITIDLLRRLSIRSLSREYGQEEEYQNFVNDRREAERSNHSHNEMMVTVEPASNRHI